jgi:hypothetical protein
VVEGAVLERVFTDDVRTVGVVMALTYEPLPAQLHDVAREVG